MISASFLFQQDHNAAAAELWSLETTDLLEPNKETVTCMQSARESLFLICELSEPSGGSKRQRNILRFQSGDLQQNSEQIAMELITYPNPSIILERLSFLWQLNGVFLVFFYVSS